MASDVIAVFKQAAGVQAPQVLARLANFGVQGRATALDADLFSAPPPPPEATAPAAAPAPGAEPSSGSAAGPLATSAAPPPSSTKFKPMFPRRPAPGGHVAAVPPGRGDADAADASAEVIEGEYEDVIDWEWPLQPPPKPEVAEEAAPAAETEADAEAGAEAAGEGEQADGEEGAAEPGKAKAPTVKLHAAAAPSSNTIELGLRLLDATVLYAVRPGTRRRRPQRASTQIQPTTPASHPRGQR